MFYFHLVFVPMWEYFALIPFSAVSLCLIQFIDNDPFLSGLKEKTHEEKKGKYIIRVTEG